jgi:hypothetical protein
LVTNFRPTDHRWHTGLAMTFAELSGHNFWGGRTYVHPDGYRQLDNNGVQEHTDWMELSLNDELPDLEERLAWITQGGEKLLEESRSIRIVLIDEKQSCWVLEFATRLHNVSGQELEFGSPTTRGRPAAGYGSLFWRGPRSFSDGGILTAEGERDVEKAMGKPARWLAFSGPHDGEEAWSTLVFVDQPSNPRYPNKWFVRAVSGYPAVSFSFIFDEPYLLPPGQNFSLVYRVVIADGEWQADRIESMVQGLESLG